MSQSRSLLSTIGCPADLRDLGRAELDALAAEIRCSLVSSVTCTGGHLGPSLGVVELTLALHRVFDSPADPILWDTGHQAYVHKLLTGRQEEFGTLRQAGGLSGYPNRAESPHDWVENSHASTALAYADGLARALQLRGESEATVVAVVGDGALTGGMCWEGLNNLAGGPPRAVVVVLNDNGRSYAPTVGGLPPHLADLPAGPSLFELLGLAYVGPVDGHDVEAVEEALRKARALRSPVVVHVRTTKGRGYAPAETDPHDRLHAVPPPRSGPGRPGWTAHAGDELVRIGARRPDVVALTAAMLEPTGLAPFAAAFPDRVVDVGIAEQHAVTSAAGLALGGLHPVVAVYSTFLNRAFDQVLLDVGLHRLPVTFLLDRAGITGADGPSHNGMWDLSVLGIVPGMRVAAPRDATRLRELLGEAVDDDRGPTAVRFPKGSPCPDLPAVGRIGGADVIADGRSPDVLVLAVGPLASSALTAAGSLRAAGLGVTVVDPRWVLPVDPALAAAAAGFRLVVTVEDNGLAGGFGDAVGRALRAAGTGADLLTLGLRQEYVQVGERDLLLASHGLDAAGIATAVLDRLGCRTFPRERRHVRTRAPAGDVEAENARGPLRTGNRAADGHSSPDL